MKKIFSYAICSMLAISMSVNSYAMELVKNGDRGDDVRKIQEMLIERGYLGDGENDGIFGPKTEQAVLAFQQENSLNADGTVGEETYNALTGGAEEPETEPEEKAAEEKAAEEEAQAVQEAAAEEAEVKEAFPSWNPESSTLAELADFVADCTDESNPGYLDPADRIAVFDMDGTIICEKAPVYFDYCLLMHRVLDDPAYSATEEERNTMQQIRDHAYTDGSLFVPEGITKEEIVAAAFRGMTIEEFRSYVADFADSTEAIGFEGMTYGESFYRPMLEVIDYLKANDFNVWMVSACEREIVRALVGRLGIPYDHIVATDVPYVASGKGEEPADEYNMTKEEVMLLGAPLDEVECGKSGKPAAIAREIGKRPVLAFGNSTGDYSMLNYAEGNPDHAGMGFFIVCDDTVREYGSDEKAADFYAEAEKQGWTAISMANDWKEIYGDNVEKTDLPGVEEAPADAA